jgi:hypothetical protein
VAARGISVALRRLFLGSGQSTEQPDRDADHHNDKDDFDDQEDEAYRDANEREEENHQNLPQQDSDHARGGDAENGLQDSQAPLEAPTLREFNGRGVNGDRKAPGTAPDYGDNSMIRPRSDGFGLPASTAISSLPLGS